MTIFQAIGNPYITKEILLIEDDLMAYKNDPKAKDFVTVFAVCIGVSLVDFFLIAIMAGNFFRC